MLRENKKAEASKRDILLIEPNYKNKYPPLGLMKISAYHKTLGDKVTFYKGLNKDLKNKLWDRIYVTSLFTFHMNLTIKTILYYKRSVKNTEDFFIGGIAASLMPEYIYDETGIMPFIGLLDKPGVLDDNDLIVDSMVPDYSILDEINYKYPASNAYFAYTTRGCIRRCDFCAVPKLEPEFKGYISISEQIKEINNKFGPKKDLLLLDNNVLASKHLNDIVSEIKSLGFTKGSTLVPHNELELLVGQLTDEYFNQDCIKRKIKEVLYRFRKRISRYPKVIENFYSIFDKYGVELDNDIEPNILIDLCHDLMPIYEKHRNKAPSKRYVDFNQGIDARLLNEENIQLLSELPIRPMRIAFDHIDMKDIYIEKIRLANKYGIKELSNYILYNYEDKPEHLYIRLKINIELNEELNCKIYSFPMKYVPVTHTNRSFVGEHWNPKYLTAINKIINVTKGIVAPGKEFFEKAFGKDLEEYFKILLMPDEYILHRFDRERDGSIDSWWDSLMSLTDDEYSEVIKIIKSNNIKELNINDLTDKAKDVLLHYLK